MTTAAT